MAEEQLRIPIAGAGVSAAYHRPAGAWASLALAHGAGAGYDHPFITGFAAALADAGVAVLRFNFPYREAGRRFPDSARAAVSAWQAVMAEAQRRSGGGPVWAAGKSYGGRMASMAVAAGMPAAGLVLLGYPLHPPGKPEKLRDEHLYGLTLPMLFLQGSNDPFATRGLLTAVVERIGPTAALLWREGGGHSFEVAGARLGPAQVGASLAEPVAAFLRAHG